MMLRRVFVLAVGAAALGVAGLAGPENRFLVTGGQAVVGGESLVSLVLVQAPAGLRAMEGVLTLTGTAGRLGGLNSPLEAQVLEQAERRVRFRLLDPEGRVGPGATDTVLVEIVVIPEEPGELKLELAVPFFVADQADAFPVASESQPLVVTQGDSPPQVGDDQGEASDSSRVGIDVETPQGTSLSLLAMGGQWAYGQVGWLTLAFDPGGRGLKRLELDLRVAEPGFLALGDAEWGALQVGALMATGAGGWKVWVADLFDQVRPGDGIVQARIGLSFLTVGTTRIDLTGIRGIDENGEAFFLPDTSVRVSCLLPPLIPGGGSPQDLDGDGKLEDLDGDGALTVHDALVLAFSFDRPPLEELPKAVDFDGDGTLTFEDARALAELATP